MKHIIYTLLILATLASCKKDTAIPVSDQLKKVWSANVIKEGTTTVFTKGAGTNVKPGYSQFRLDLSSATSARLTEFDGNTFTGQWALSADEKTLTLSNLTPQPTGTSGTIAYTVGSVSETTLALVRTTTSLKSGGTVNDYQLTNP